MNEQLKPNESNVKFAVAVAVNKVAAGKANGLTAQSEAMDNLLKTLQHPGALETFIAMHEPLKKEPVDLIPGVPVHLSDVTKEQRSNGK